MGTRNTKEEQVIDPLALALNEVLRQKASALYQALSALGKELYFPRGILAQTAEAKKSAHRLNATIGIATSGEEPLYLPSINKYLKGLEPGEAFPYAPITGIPELREAWRRHQLDDNPDLRGKSFSLPHVTSGLTHALSVCADIFCDAGDALMLPDKAWGNYRMIFGTRRGARIYPYPLFNQQRELDLKGFRETLLSLLEKPKVLVIMNFPNNPTGYSPSTGEAREITRILLEAAETGANIVVILDDAYFGLFYEDNLFTQSLFSLLAEAHPRITAVKVDGPTKENYAWGLRIGFITFSVVSNGGVEEVYRALEKKVSGLVRGTISACSTLSQSLLLGAMNDPHYRKDKLENYSILKDRYLEVKRVLAKPEYNNAFQPYPFNSGYFLSLALKNVGAEELRRDLLDAHGVGVIATDRKDLRLAFSCLRKEQVEGLFDILYLAAEDMRKRE